MIGASILLFTDCAVRKDIFTTGDIHETAPPNCVRVDNNLYYDRTEISNLHWLEYMEWNRRVFGDRSEQYLATLPDTGSWIDIDTCGVKYDLYYLRHPVFKDNPVVGVTQAQAEAFAKWRSDRVFEHMLIEGGYIKYHPEQDASTYFTTEKYLNGEYFRYRHHPNINFYPKFRLPSIDEWRKAVAFSETLSERNSATVCSAESCGKCRESNPVVHSEMPVCMVDTSGHAPTRPIFEECVPQAKAIPNLRGNVREWSLTENIAMGGGWADSLKAILEQDTFHTEISSPTTGFRLVSEWVELKADKGKSTEGYKNIYVELPPENL